MSKRDVFAEADDELGAPPGETESTYSPRDAAAIRSAAGSGTSKIKTPAQRATDIVFCPTCGRDNEPGAANCSACGRNLGY